jgi:peptidylprolyl isomerase
MSVSLLKCAPLYAKRDTICSLGVVKAELQFTFGRSNLRQFTPEQLKQERIMAETLTLHLSTGDVVIQLRPDLAPNHVARIVELASEGFYDGVKFHRVIDGFMAQGGCPNGTGTGGSDKPDLAQEFNDEPHIRGICSMARTMDPNSANSQFFIVFDDATFLDRQYTVWGQVSEGMDNVDALPKGEPPREPGVINSVTVN